MPNMKCFNEIVNGWIQSTIFAKSSILDVSLGSKYVSDYPDDFSFIDWGFQFEYLKNFFNLISIFFKGALSGLKQLYVCLYFVRY